VESGVVKRFIEFLSFEENPKLQYEALWAITNITSGTSEQTKVVLECGAIPPIIKILYSVHFDLVDQCNKKKK
jgi:importin subunit alpha-6/7